MPSASVQYTPCGIRAVLSSELPYTSSSSILLLSACLLCLTKLSKYRNKWRPCRCRCCPHCKAFLWRVCLCVCCCLGWVSHQHCQRPIVVLFCCCLHCVQQQKTCTPRAVVLCVLQEKLHLAICALHWTSFPCGSSRESHDLYLKFNMTSEMVYFQLWMADPVNYSGCTPSLLSLSLTILFFPFLLLLKLTLGCKQMSIFNLSDLFLIQSQPTPLNLTLNCSPKRAKYTNFFWFLFLCSIFHFYILLLVCCCRCCCCCCCAVLCCCCAQTAERKRRKMPRGA